MYSKKLTYTVEEAKRKLEKYCAYQDRCHFEINAKLREMKMIPEACEQIVLHLMTHNFLNEERFAKSYARGKFRIKGWGKQRIKRELKHREISDYHIKVALLEIDDTMYIDKFWSLFDKKIETGKYDSLKAKKKLNDYFLRLGYEYDLIQQAMQKLNQ